jgi:DNA-binding phage protein
LKSSRIKSDDKVTVMEIAAKMRTAGLPDAFIASAAEMAFQFEGVLDLFLMWNDESDQAERDEIVADIQELVEDCEQKDLVEGVYVRFDDLESISKDIRSFKDGLRAIVDTHGGLTQLAQKIEVPQPSLSRFFNSASMPRRNTLNKIAKALGLSQVQISTEWSK